jgi:GTP-binding protein HflX
MLKELITETRAVLVGVELKGSDRGWTLQDSLDELARLARTAGLTVVGTTWQKLARPNAGTWIGSGKVQELKELATAENATYVLFDDELSPGQHTKLEKTLGDGIRIIDRTRLILDIFSQHASSREGKLQVELAQYQYLLPRLAGMRAGLSQQTGGAGVGLRGSGETQLELDRRQARRRITTLRAGLEQLRGQRRQHRTRRDQSGLPVVALVGYTNAGKSSLLNALTGAGALVQDKLFATLDPTTRRLSLPSGRETLLTDTVGFIRKLPHSLVAAFRATLEGIEEASLILHVVDSSHAHAAAQIVAVEKVLADLAIQSTPRLLVWNKIDLLPGQAPPAILGPPREHSVCISAKRGQNLQELLAAVDRLLAQDLVEMRLLVPRDRYDMVTMVYEQGRVDAREEMAEGVRLRASVPSSLSARLAEFVEPA